MEALTERITDPACELYRRSVWAGTGEPIDHCNEYFRLFFTDISTAALLYELSSDGTPRSILM